MIRTTRSNETSVAHEKGSDRSPSTGFDRGRGRFEPEPNDLLLARYLADIRHIPLLEKRETVQLSEKIASSDREFRRAMNRIPIVVIRLLEMWRGRKQGGRNTGLLAEGYYGDVKFNWAEGIDRSFASIEGMVALSELGEDIESLECIERLVSHQEAIAACLEECKVRFEIYLEIHQELDDLVTAPKTRESRRKVRELGLADEKTRRSLALASDAAAKRKLARQRFSFHNLKLVVKVAKNFRGLGIPFLDLIQEGNCGLMRAVEKFDPSRGFTFSTYAVWWIEQSVIRHLQNQSRTVRTPSHLFQENRKIEAAATALRGRSSEEPSISEVAKRADMKVEEAERISTALKPIACLDAPVAGDDSSCLGDLLALEPDREPGDDHDDRAIQKIVRDALHGLPKREKSILELRFGIKTGQGLTLREIGERLGISRERVRQIQTSAFAELQKRADVQSLANYLSGVGDAA